MSDKLLPKIEITNWCQKGLTQFPTSWPESGLAVVLLHSNNIDNLTEDDLASIPPNVRAVTLWGNPVVSDKARLKALLPPTAPYASKVPTTIPGRSHLLTSGCTRQIVWLRPSKVLVHRVPSLWQGTEADWVLKLHCRATSFLPPNLEDDDDDDDAELGS